MRCSRIPPRPWFPLKRTAAAFAALGICGVAHSARADDNGKVVSQTYNAVQHVTETRLANGLTILSKESHAAPVVYFSVWYRVGSRNEITGQTGLSHILEHMMFKGTRELPPGAITHLFLENGGQINASTSSDRTEYHELIAADRLELAVRVEADRMMNSAFDPTELKHEMTVVRSELEGDNNDPDYDLYTNIFQPAAFEVHPYHWPTIGWKTDVEAVANRRDVIYSYYKQHYMPNNAFVVMVGDFDTKKAVALCSKYFGAYGAGKLDRHVITPEPQQRGERRVKLRRPGTSSQVIIGYHVPGVGEPEHYALDVLSTILSAGRSGRMYRALVETGIADGADAENPDYKDPYVFTFSASVRSGVTADAAEKALKDEVAKAQTTLVSDDEIKRAINQIEASFIYRNDSVTAQAGQIGSYEVLSGYRYLDTYLDRIKRVTAADIRNAAKKYFTDDNSTVATFDPLPIPPGTTLAGAAGEKNFGAAPPVTDPKQKAILASLDKKFNAGVKTTAPANAPKPTRVVLGNGMTVIVEENHANATVSMSGRILAGSMLEQDGKWGLAGITAAMLNRGTTGKSALDLALALESVGAHTSFSGGTEEAGFGAGCLAKDFGLTLATLADEMRNPAFPASELERLRAQSLSGLERERQDTGGTGGAGAIASIAFTDAIYPKGHPYWSPTIDDQETALKALTRSDVAAFHSAYYRPDTAILVIVGDVKAADAIAAVNAAFGDWAKPAAAAPSLTIPDVLDPVASGKAQILVTPGAPQTSVLWGFPSGLKRTDPDFYAATIMNYILGGDPFGSRMGRTIRDQNGLAYTVYSGFQAQHGAGPFSAFLGANPNNANKALAFLRSITSDMQKNGVTADEVEQAKKYLTGSYPLRLETNSGVAGQLLVSEDYGLGLDYIQKRAALINAVTPAQVTAAAKKYLRPEKEVLVISGAAPG